MLDLTSYKLSIVNNLSPQMKKRLWAPDAHLDLCAADLVRDVIGDELPKTSRILTIDEIHELCQRFFIEQPHFKRVWLFGSYARGEADENSDVDLGYDIDYDWKGRFASREQCECWTAANELFMRAGVLAGIDLVPHPGSKRSRFREAYERDRILMYEKIAYD